VPFHQKRQIELCAIRAVENQCFVICFKPAYYRIDRAVPASENVFNLVANFAGVGDGRFGVVIEPRTSAQRIAFRPVVGNQDKHPTTGTRHAQDVMGQHFTEVRPPQIKHAAEIAEGHENAGGRVGRDRNVNATVHTLQHCNRGRVFREVALARQPRFRAAKGFTVTMGVFEQPVNALSNGFAVNIAHNSPDTMGSTNTGLRIRSLGLVFRPKSG